MMPIYDERFAGGCHCGLDGSCSKFDDAMRCLCGRHGEWRKASAVADPHPPLLLL